MYTCCSRLHQMGYSNSNPYPNVTTCAPVVQLHCCLLCQFLARGVFAFVYVCLAQVWMEADQLGREFIHQRIVTPPHHHRPYLLISTLASPCVHAGAERFGSVRTQAVA